MLGFFDEHVARGLYSKNTEGKKIEDSCGYIKSQEGDKVFKNQWLLMMVSVGLSVPHFNLHISKCIFKYI